MGIYLVLRKDFLRIEFSLRLIPASGRLCGVERFWKDNGAAQGDGARVRNGGALRLRDVPRAIAGTVRADFAAWVERNFFNARAGRIGNISYTRAGELDDAIPKSSPRRGRREARRLWYTEAYDRALVDHMEPLRPEEADFLLHHPHVALQLMLGVTDLRGLRCLRRSLTHEVDRLQRRVCRTRYYVRDNARRRALAAERRRITRRTTSNSCPTPEALRAAFTARRESHDARIRLGSLLEDLECYVDNCLRFGPDGEILGRNGGVRGWLRKYAPELSRHYKTLMRYKALARRLRQAVGVHDPVPADTLLQTDEAETRDGDVPASRPDEDRPARMYRPVVPERARRTAAKILGGCPNTFAALFRAVDAALGGDG